MTVCLENGVHNNGGLDVDDGQIRYIPLSYDSANSKESALRLVLSIRPDWESPDSNVEFVRFTDGITNTLLKAVNKRAGLSKSDVDKEAILLRAYGHGTDLIIDRHRETQNHELLMRHGLAPELLARFENGMMYRFIQGAVTQPEDLRKPDIYKAVARRLAEWHAVVPCISSRTGHSRKNSRVDGAATVSALDGDLGDAEFQQALDNVAPGKPPPNVWTVMQKWIFALPTDTEAQRARQAELQQELKKLVSELSQRPGLGVNGLVFAHCDLLSGNVIVLPKSQLPGGDKSPEPQVTFIDYEYATPSPAAFDLANHFAEWGGFDCDFSVLPTRAQRREFIAEYIDTYFALLEKKNPNAAAVVDKEAEIEQLHQEVDHYRGVPGFYWGIWALIQATISEIDFDYASYAETRLGEYYAWRAEVTGERQKSGKEMPLRERRWAQEK
ncbi:kinase-like domain-containing protein [Corynascus novoguineensis]|uniref:ethanolamine kinase n=1 Tax=Corynascus novoguineensis TaxID=1126955 RepID=A0AAN7D0R4_9PEZI|nr:kinase-like domain-containing protein [Corynascus novoguineensis]